MKYIYIHIYLNEMGEQITLFTEENHLLLFC